MDNVIYSGRPSEKRGEREERAYDLLDRLGIEYLRTDHEATYTMETCEAIDALMDMKACKNLFMRNKQKTQYYLVVIQGDKHFEAKTLQTQLGLPRLSFGHADVMETLLNVSPGSVSILALANDFENRVKLIVDGDVLKQEYFGCHPCVNTSSLKIKTTDIFDKFLPYINHKPVFYTP